MTRREEVLKVWASLKDKFIELSEDACEVSAYRECFIIMDGSNPHIEPLGHDEKRTLRCKGSVERVVTNDASDTTGLPLEFQPNLRYCYDERVFDAQGMVVLANFPSMEEVD